MTAIEHIFRLPGGDALVLTVYEQLTLEDVYDHGIRTGIYNIIRSTTLDTTPAHDIVEDFLKELK